VSWAVREAALATAVAALTVVARPEWLAPAARAWLAVVGLVALAAALSAVLRGTRGEARPGTADWIEARLAGQIRDLRDVEQASDLELAITHHLRAPLSRRLRDFAAHRLLARHDVDLQREPERARELLGPEAWELVRPDAERATGPIDLRCLERAADALEEL